MKLYSSNYFNSSLMRSDSNSQNCLHPYSQLLPASLTYCIVQSYSFINLHLYLKYYKQFQQQKQCR